MSAADNNNIITKITHAQIVNREGVSSANFTQLVLTTRQ